MVQARFFLPISEFTTYQNGTQMTNICQLIKKCWIRSRFFWAFSFHWTSLNLIIYVPFCVLFVYMECFKLIKLLCIKCLIIHWGEFEGVSHIKYFIFELLISFFIRAAIFHVAVGKTKICCVSHLVNVGGHKLSLYRGIIRSSTNSCALSGKHFKTLKC